MQIAEEKGPDETRPRLWLFFSSFLWQWKLLTRKVIIFITVKSVYTMFRLKVLVISLGSLLGGVEMNGGGPGVYQTLTFHGSYKAA